ncbi:MAG: hypothetical protein JST30_07485 [Armatimonadetes bacterium]|nr:hypothetical protein [Armatimonadota bacterium]
MNVRTRTMTVALGLFALATTAFTQDKDWTTLTSKDGSFSASFPPAWVLGDSDDPDYRRSVEKFKQDNPKIAAKMSANTNDKQILLAYDTGNVTPEGWIDVVNVMKQPHGGLTTKMYEDVYREVAKNMQTKGKLDHKVVDGPSGKALTYWGTIVAKVGEAENAELDLYGVLFLKGDHVYIVTFMAKGGELKSKRPVWDKVVKTIKSR